MPGKELEAQARSNQILHQANENEMISVVFTAKMEKKWGDYQDASKVP